MSINKKLAPSKDDIKVFLNKLDFTLPIGYLEFLKVSNGAEIANEEDYVLLWPLTDLFDLNLAYDMSSFASSLVLVFITSTEQE
ncbi:SMI1/KNR4 family protein [Flavivirga rizhaonensis]|uniref:SMI1/KNR4 family protein n=1 Tax=Flavivirga rizhaonensis TaxID=2559571 RepID=A0A4S1DVJ2_9FLAO|nr:SMI1/KNR4 family protein [Flavivirga rizhaonensis]TGV02130.1 SMI1/KNR4 family protein [Flavivirga rizhaonensis]